MILDLELLSELTRGAVKIENKRGAYQFYRFNDAEMEYYAPTKHIKKSYAVSGVEIDALTDARAVSISGKVRPGSSRTYYSFDIISDGALVGEIKNFEHSEMIPDFTGKALDIGEFSGRVELPCGKKHLRIVFPWSMAVDLYEIELEGATFATRIPTERNMLIYGDSITQGYDAENPSRSYASRLAFELSANAFNKGIGGEVFRPELAAIKNDIDPDIITVAYGTNDSARCELPVIEKNASAFYATLAENYPNARIFAISPIWRARLDDADRYDRFLAVAKLIDDIAKKHDNITHIAGIDFVPHEEYYFADTWLHPRNVGFDHYADNVIEKIKSLI